MPPVFPFDGREYKDYVDVDDLSILLSRRPNGVLGSLKRILASGRPVRILYKPAKNTVFEAIPCFHIEDLRVPLNLPKDYVEQIVAFRHRATQDTIEIPFPETV